MSHKYMDLGCLELRTILITISLSLVFSIGFCGSEDSLFQIYHSPQTEIYHLQGEVDAAHARVYPFQNPVRAPKRA